MITTKPPDPTLAPPGGTNRPAGSLLRPLAAFQASLLIVTTVEALVVSTASGFLMPAAILAGLAALVVAGAASTAPILSLLRWVRRTERLVLATATVDVLLSLILARRFVEPTAIVTRLLVPYLMLRLVKTELSTPTREVAA